MEGVVIKDTFWLEDANESLQVLVDVAIEDMDRAF